MGSLEPEELARHHLRLSAASIAENVGFAGSSDEALNVVSDVMRRFIQQLWQRGKFYAEHAGRTQLSPDDVTLAFRRMHLSGVEIADYIGQVAPLPNVHAVPRFPASKPGMRTIHAPSCSQRELTERPEHVPAHMPALHPEWNGHGAYSYESNKPSTSSSSDRKPKASDSELPDFLGMDIAGLGLVKQPKHERLPLVASLAPDVSSATGIRSSANGLVPNGQLSPYLKKKQKMLLLQSKMAASPSPAASPVPPALKKDLSRSSTPLFESKSSPVPPPAQRGRPKKIRIENGTAEPSGAASPMPTLERSYCDEPESSSLASRPQSSLAYENDTNASTPEYRMGEAVPAESAESRLARELAKKAAREKKRKEREDKEKRKEEKRQQRQLEKLAQVEMKREQERIEREREMEQKRKKEEEDKKKRQREEEEAAAQRREEEERERERQRKEKEKERERERERQREKEREESEQRATIKLTFKDIHSDNPSTAFSPEASTPRSSNTDVHPPTLTSQNDDDDSNTTPFVEATTSGKEPLLTTFPLDLSMDDRKDDRDKKKEKKKKKDKDRDRSASPHSKDKKRDKEHKKKKKKDKKERDDQESPCVPRVKIKLSVDESPTPRSADPPLTFKFKPMPETPREEKKVEKLTLSRPKEEKIAPLKLPPLSLHKEETTPEKKRAAFAKETKPEPALFSVEKIKKEKKEKHRETPPPPLLFTPTITPKKEKKEKEKKKDEEPPAAAASDVWICPVCSVAYVDGANMVGCDMCDNWFHWHCVGLLVAPPDDVPWFCQKCADKKMKKDGKRKSSSSAQLSAKKRKL